MSYLQQVVRVYATSQFPDYDCPWQAQPPSRSTGSGVAIADGKILTGAHVIANATFLQVQKPADPHKAVARVEAVSHDCDLALLSVEDDDFFAGITPAEIGELPDLRDHVSAIGFPVGGEEISITEGVVSRVEVQRYSHSQRHLLAVTIDAAINEGSSGGPVYHNGKVSGIAFQKISVADNIGEMVPAPLIRTFLSGVASGKAPDIPSMGITVQNMENPLLRRKMGLKDKESGVMVVAVDHGGSASGVLKSGDVLRSIAGMKIANNGTVHYADRYRTRYDVVLGHCYVGDTLGVGILRDGQAMHVELKLQPRSPLVSRSHYDSEPTYFVYGGMVFQVLTRDFLATWDEWWNKAPKEFLYYYYFGQRSEERREIVILTQVLNDKINVGYEEFYNEAVLSINGHRPRDMSDFVARLDQAEGVIELRTSGPGVIMLDSEEVRQAKPRIMNRYHITSDRSADLKTEQ